MDWEQQGSLEPSLPADAAAAAGSDQVQQPVPHTSKKRVGRLISHKKSASDTFAFAAAAGGLQKQDFLSLLQAPIEEVLAADAASRHSRHASTGAVMAAVEGQQQLFSGLPSPLSASSFGSMQVLAATEAGRPADGPHSSLPQPLPDAAGSTVAAAARGMPSHATSSPSVPAASAAAADMSAGANVDVADIAAAATAGSGSGGGQLPSTQTRSNALDTTQLDPRKARRILANRQSAQRSRMKRLRYMHDLEARKADAAAGVRELQAQVAALSQTHARLKAAAAAGQAELEQVSQELSYQQALQASLKEHLQYLYFMQQQHQHQQQAWADQQGYCMQQQHHHLEQQWRAANGYNGYMQQHFATCQEVYQQVLEQGTNGPGSYHQQWHQQAAEHLQHQQQQQQQQHLRSDQQQQQQQHQGAAGQLHHKQKLQLQHQQHHHLDQQQHQHQHQPLQQRQHLQWQQQQQCSGFPGPGKQQCRGAAVATAAVAAAPFKPREEDRAAAAAAAAAVAGGPLPQHGVHSPSMQQQQRQQQQQPQAGRSVVTAGPVDAVQAMQAGSIPPATDPAALPAAAGPAAAPGVAGGGAAAGVEATALACPDMPFIGSPSLPAAVAGDEMDMAPADVEGLLQEDDGPPGLLFDAPAAVPAVPAAAGLMLQQLPGTGSLAASISL